MKDADEHAVVLFLSQTKHFWPVASCILLYLSSARDTLVIK